MTDVQRGIASFVLRFTEELWQDPSGEPHVQWRGQVRHVQSNDETRFTNFADALAFIQKYLTQLTLDAASGGPAKMDQDKVLRESFKLWEQFASTYSNLMFDAMEKTIKQSDALRQQMDQAAQQAVKAWQMPFGTGQNEVVEALGRIEREMRELRERVERLEKKVSEK